MCAAFDSIAAYETLLARELLAGMKAIPEVRVWGITDESRLGQRVPTVAITHQRLSPREVAEYLADRGIYVWHGNFYALPLTEALGLEPAGLVRIGLLHYNQRDEVRQLLAAIEALSGAGA